MTYRFLEKALIKMFLFVVNVGCKDTKIGIGHILAYLVQGKYYAYSANHENIGEKVMNNFSATVSMKEVEMLPAKPAGSKMTFPGDNTPI